MDNIDNAGKVRSTILTAAITGFLTVIGTFGAAYLTGYFDLSKTEKQNTGTIDLEKLKFANELVKTALAAQNPANSLKFYADIGLLNSLKVEAVQEYARAENERLKSGSNGESILPDFKQLKRSGLWLDKDFFSNFIPKADPNITLAFTTTGNYILQGFGINSNTNRLSNFLGQVAYETNEFQVLAEAGSERELSEAYANRLGNGSVESGDGYRYRGRGFFQITGKENYQKVSQLTGIDLVKDPSVAENSNAALLVAAAWWTNAGLNELADANQTEAITKKINGGLNGLNNRVAVVKRAKDLLEKQR
jgi:putative chitinase